MNKKELIDAVYAKAEDKAKEDPKFKLTKAVAHDVVDFVLASVTEGLVSEGKVVLPGFGTFEVRARTARVGRNPRTGEKLKIKASKVAAFKPGKGMKEAVNAKKSKK